MRTLSCSFSLHAGSALCGQSGDPATRLGDLDPAAARAHELAVLQQVADLSLLPPRLNTSPLPQYDYDQLDYGMTLGIGPMRHANTGLEPLRGSNVYASTDQGRTWERRGNVRFPKPSWDEHMFVELKDGRIWMVARTGDGPMQAFSADGGRTWTQPTYPTFKHPVARFHLRRLASGRILLIKHGRTIDAYEGRSQLTAWLSADEGRSWRGGLMLDERRGFSYPDGFQAPDGTIYVSYDRNRSSDGEILLARFREDDVLAGRVSHPDSKLQLLISRPLKKKEPVRKR